jgi:hypothetical protein
VGKKTWSKKFIQWTEGKEAYLSVVFTWDLPAARERAEALVAKGYHIHAGGPAVMLNPDYLQDVAECNTASIPCLHRHNPNATFTSRGCIRRCSFCAVPKIEGDLVELDEWDVLPIVCDNNLLACSIKHFDSVVDKLKPLSGIDFNQGLDARLLTKYHADRLAELDCMVRLAWDDTAYEKSFRRAYELFRDAGFPANKIHVYVLIGYKDTPEDALYRLQEVWKTKSFPNPMRYQPLDALEKNSYVEASWTEAELRRYMKYWSRLHWYNVRFHIPFEDFHYLKGS